MGRFPKNHLMVTTMLAVAGYSSSAVAAAQDRIAPGVPPSSLAATGVEEIIVTAQKREQNVQKVPISMTVVTGKQISDFHTNDLHSLQGSVPNLYIERLNWADTIYLRGFGTGPANFAFDSSVSLYVDGVYSGRPQQFTSPFFDVQRVEVLRGPQGALFGKNTAAGAVSVVTANPTRNFAASVTGSYNFDFDGPEVSGYVSGPLSDTLSMRVSGRLLDQKGYVHNTVTGKDNPRRQEGLGRVALRYDAPDGGDLTAKVQYAKTTTKGENQVRAPLNATGPVTDDQANDPNPFGYPDEAHFSGWNGSLTGNLPVGNHTLTMVSGYSSFKSHRANSYSTDVPAIFLNRIIENFKQYSTEVRIASPADQPLTYIIGGYFDWSRYHVGQPFDFNLLGGILAGTTAGDLYQTARTYSAFTQATYNFTPAFRLIGSLRYTHITKSGHYVASNTGFPILGAPFTEDGRIKENHLDPSATLQYDVAPHVMVYATYARGSKSGGFVGNNITNYGTMANPVLDPFTFAPEKSESYEAGIKSSFDDGRVVANLSIYHTRIKDLQTSVFCASCASGGFVTKNAGSATSKGVEASLIFQPVDTLRLSLNGAYQDAKYNDFLGANCLARQSLTVCDPSAPASAPNSVANNNLAGYPLTYASKWTGNVEVQHRLPIGSAMKLTTTLRAAYRSRYYNSDDQSLFYGVQKGFTKIDGRIELAAVPGPWSIAVIGKNLTNRHTYSFANAWPFPLTNAPTAHKYLDETRNITLEATLHF